MAELSVFETSVLVVVLTAILLFNVVGFVF